ncbi:PGF-pre-PGF domain-containing protein [Haloplanus rubicundus]|uniref:PGF-pre-PGF domain-containing protein n=2 Tax=Haloplanus rubicundus TaxID=1547898 RepID=A0A345E517_9EURY|nr:PGF-pre-PGF domain-containing protein [Haloplanus rubicundus]
MPNTNPRVRVVPHAPNRTMSRRRTALVALTLATIALALPTVAAPLTERATDPASANVTLTTENSANADYVTITDTGTLALDFTTSNPALAGDGLNPEARTYVADAFRIHYDGDAAATVWITSDAAGITFLADGAPVDAHADAVTLAPDESVAVGVVVDTEGAEPPESSEFTVRAQVADPDTGTDTATPSPESGIAATDPDEPATTRITSPTPTSRVLTLRDTTAGRSITLDLDRLVVARAGAGALTLDELSVVSDGGDLGLDVSVTPPDSAGALPADAGVRPLGAVRVVERRGAVERATLRFAVDRAYLEAAGYASEYLTVYRYDGHEWSERGVEVVGRTDERVFLETETPGFSTFVVAAAVPDLRVTSADLGSESITAGERTTVTAEVTNAGDASGARTIALTLDGDPVAERLVDLNPGESTTLSFRVDPSDAGTYAVRVGSADAGRLVVERPETNTGRDAEGPPGGAAASPPATPSTDDSPAGTPADAEPPIVEPAGGAPTETLWLVALVGVVVVLALVRRLRE